MTMQISLPADLDARLRREADAKGLSPEDVVIEALRERLAENGRTDLGAILRQWQREDATDDPAELAEQQRELDELKAALNESHSSSRKLFP